MRTRSNSSGFVMPLLLIMIAFVSISYVYIISQLIVSNNLANAEERKLNSQLAADGGLDVGLIELTQDGLWTGTVGEIDLYDGANFKTTYQVVVSDLASGRKAITSTGRVYEPKTDTSPKYVRSLQIEVEGITASNTSIVTGVGGLVMANSSRISDGSVFVNGRITMSNTAQIGTSSNSLNVFVANQTCPFPADATFPRLCTPGERDNPISISNAALIYGDVSANNQISSAGMSSGGLIATSGVATQPLPAHDREAQKTAATTTLTAAAASCTTNNGTRTWPANVRITGNVTISRSCRVTVLGNAWVQGNLTMTQTGSIITSNSLGTTVPVIMVDGTTGFSMNNSSTLVKNSSNTNVQIITYWSAASCRPDCSDVTGVNLANSQNTTTINILNSGGAEEAIFYARWSRVSIANSVNVGALVGQVVNLNQSATIAFSSSIPGFTPITTWVQRGYIRVFE